MIKSRSCYVYVYMDPRIKGLYKYLGIVLEYQPFYIGKGRGKRLYDHLSKQNKQNDGEKNKLLSELDELGLTPIIRKIYTDLTDHEAEYLETLWIQHFGYKKKEGCLLNAKNGTSINKLEKRLTNTIDIDIVDLSPFSLMSRINIKYVCLSYNTLDIISAHVSDTDLAEKLKITTDLVRKVVSADYPYNIIKGIHIIKRVDLPSYFSDLF